MSAISSSRPKTDAATALGEAAKIYSRHAFVIVGASITVQLVSLMLTFFVMGGGGLMALGSRIIPLTASMLLTGVLTTVLLSIRETGTVPPISEVIARAMPMVPALVGLAWLSGIAVGFALIAFIVPGIYVYLRLALAPSLLVLSRHGVIDSMKASWAITSSAKWSVFVLLVAQVGCTFGIAYVSYKAVGGAFGAEENYMVAEAFVTALIVPIPTLAFGDLTLRLSGIFPDPVTGMRMANTSAGPAHRVHVPSGVHVPGGAAPVPGSQATPGYGVPQGAAPYAAPPAYGAPQPATPFAAHAGHQPIQPQPQSLWNRAPQPQAQAAAHPHFSDPPSHPYAAPAPGQAPAAPLGHGQPAHPIAAMQPQPYATQPHGHAPHQPYPQPAAAQPQPYAQPPQPYAQPAAAQPQPYAQPAAAQPQPYAQPPQAFTPQHQAPPPPPSRPSVAPPGMG